MCKVNPSISLLSTMVLIFLLRPFSFEINNKGESGSPGLMPLDGMNGFMGGPLRRIEKKAEDVIFIIL